MVSTVICDINRESLGLPLAPETVLRDYNKWMMVKMIITAIRAVAAIGLAVLVVARVSSHYHPTISSFYYVLLCSISQ